jgi:predicted Rdx family selenoprotein
LINHSIAIPPVLKLIKHLLRRSWLAQVLLRVLAQQLVASYEVRSPLRSVELHRVL